MPSSTNRYQPTRMIGVAAGLLALAALAAACGSSSSSTTTTTAASGGGTTTATTGAAGGSTTTTSAGGGGGAAAFVNKFKGGSNQTFTASYKVTDSTGKVTSFTIAQQPPNSSFSVTSTSGKVQFITTGGKSYYCLQHSGSWTCLSAGAATASYSELFKVVQPGTYLPYLQAAAAAEGGHVTTSSKTVNGIDMSCVTVSGAKGQTGSGTYCVTSDGVLGYVQSSSSAGGTVELTSYSSSVPSGSFTLPATPTSMPSIP